MKKIILLILLIVLTVHFESIRGDDRDHDTITINGIPAGDTAFVLVDGLSASGCKNDQKFMVTDNSPFSIGDFIANTPTCKNNEVFVFCEGKMAVRKTKNWVGNQNLTIRLTNFKTITVKFYYPTGNNEAGIAWGEMMQTCKARANVLFQDFRFGLQILASFIPTDKMDDYETLINEDYSSCCSDLFTTLERDFFTENIINVYLVDRIADEGDSRGYSCRNKPNVIFINKNTATVETLAHEIGHAMSLFHSDAMADFTPENIMDSGGTIRNIFHLGQAFQTNFNKLSFLKNYFPSTTTRSCIGPGSTIRCPMQSLNF